ncbi:MAG: extracellular solute-binding protein [Verrucomicrobia bacterium]|nr:extracellular solute-binding protein [Verrucomicrobiota bacterium]
MLARLGLGVALLAVVALPFAVRPAKPALAPADDTVVVITPHNEAIRSEFARGFAGWYRARTGRTARVDWRVLGGTSEITRFLESEYLAAFRLHWTRQPGKPWSTEVQAGFTDNRLAPQAAPEAREARAAFLASEVSCGIDVFFGGGSYDYVREAAAGRIVPARVRRAHPEWFDDAVIPARFTGEQYRDEADRWFGNVISSYGILYNVDALARLGLPAPQAWSDLADPRYAGSLALADPTKSSSMAKAFENMIQQQIHAHLAAAGGADEAQAVRAGWRDGLRLIQRLAANARYFTDSSQKPPIDVAQGDCAAGICIDFYGRAQAGVVANRGASRLVFVTPQGGTVNSVDPIAILRGAPHREVAELFVEYTLTLDAQKLWNFQPGVPGGPERFALRRLPVRRDFYAHAEWKPRRSDPDAAPFDDPAPLVYRPEWTAHLFRELAFVVRVMCLDSHAELQAASAAIAAAPPDRRARANAALAELSAVDYEQVNGSIRRTLGAKNKVEEVRMATELGGRFRRQYRAAEAIARDGK